ncbi:MAG: SGNH/GDSL hydrolase family protein [Burkholderiaceae bacterium]
MCVRDLARRCGIALLAAAGACVLASCGGGTQQVEPFVARQLVVIGDENSGLAPDGKRYAINGLDANGAFSCGLLPMWTQSLAGLYGLVVDRCTGGSTATPQAITHAAYGAKAADIDAQIDAQLALGAPSSKDLYTVMVGLHDIIEVYETFAGDKTCNNDPKVATPMEQVLRDRGHHVAEQINRLIDADARIVVSTVYDVGLTPYGRAKEAASPGQAALLSCLTAAYNARVRVDVLQDGRYWALVLADDVVAAITKVPSTYGISNVTDAACATAAPDCTTATLVSGATSGTHLWADDRHMGPVAHAQLANQAVTRVRNNPF